MATIISNKVIRAFEKFNESIQQFMEETQEDYAVLYEDAYTTRKVKDFKLYKNGKLKWVESDGSWCEQMFDDDDAKDWLSFWKANLRRAKRYWAMDVDRLDKIQDGEIEDDEE